MAACGCFSAQQTRPDLVPRYFGVSTSLSPGVHRLYFCNAGHTLTGILGAFCLEIGCSSCLPEFGVTARSPGPLAAHRTQAATSVRLVADWSGPRPSSSG